MKHQIIYPEGKGDSDCIIALVGEKAFALKREIKIQCKVSGGKPVWCIQLYVNDKLDESYIRRSPKAVAKTITALCECKELPWYCGLDV